MRILRSISAARSLCERARRRGRSVGLVPTMGALHDGHLSLVRRARRETDVVVVSIFVNPIQFGPQEDYRRYPRNVRCDEDLLRRAGCDLIFAPTVRQMYPDDFSTFVEETRLSEPLCGRSRPGHLRGVTTVVIKLFSIVRPTVAYFGWKDAQQALVIKRMVRDLNVPVTIRVLPTVREPDGLAMSSRNAYLSGDERRNAVVLSRALAAAKEMIGDGERRASRIRAAMKRLIAKVPTARIDYVEIVSADTLERVKRIKGPVLIALAVYVGRARLIDNLRVNIR